MFLGIYLGHKLFENKKTKVPFFTGYILGSEQSNERICFTMMYEFFFYS